MRQSGRTESRNTEVVDSNSHLIMKKKIIKMMKKGRGRRKKYERNDIQDSESNKNHIWFPHQEGSSPWNAGRMALTSYSKYT